MRFYENLGRIECLNKSFLLKLCFVCLVGFIIQFLGSICFFGFTSSALSGVTKILILFFIFIAVVFGVFFYLKKLIHPIIIASNELNNHVLGKKAIQLPVNYDDEIGLLLRNINYTIKNNNKSVEEKLNLISLLTHDLRQYAGNPISLCQILLKEKALSKRSIEIANFITENAQKQVGFIDSFIELLKFENEISEAEKSIISININNLKSSILDDFKLKLLNKNIKLVFSHTEDNIVIVFEEVLFYQILSNLIDNSIKFSTDGSTVIVNLKIVDEKYSISVIDNGIGFDPQISSELFNKFTIYGRLGTHNEKSNGIGLYLCRTIAEKFNAKIVGISKGDFQGAKFVLLIDMHK